MASFSAGTTFTDGVANDVTAAKLAALVNAATPTSGFIQDRTAETTIAVNDTLLIGDASDSNNLKRMTVADFRSAATFGTTTSTAATITSGTITNLASTTGTITTGVIPTLTSSTATFGTTTSTAATITSGTITNLASTTGTITTGVIPTLTSTTLITTGTGTAAAPAIVPTGNTNTGIFFPAADTIAFAEGGAEAMRIDSSGNVGIGVTPSSGFRLTSKGATATSAGYNLLCQNSSGSTCLLTRDDGLITTGLLASSPFNNTTAGAANLAVFSDGNFGRSTSSIKYKKDVVNTNHGLSEVMKLRPVTYKGKSENDGNTGFGGLIAEEVHNAGLTEFVQYADDGTPDALSYGNMVSLAFKAIQEQQAIIEELKNKVAALETA